jgi:hypothetical protein
LIPVDDEERERWRNNVQNAWAALRIIAETRTARPSVR